MEKEDNMTQRNVLLTVLLVAASALTVTGKARAQEDEERQFSLNLFQASYGNDSFLTLEGASVPEKFDWFVGGMFGYQYKPLVIRACSEIEDGNCNEYEDEQTTFIRNMITFDVGGGVSFWRVLEVALVIPAVLYQDGRGTDNALGEPIIEDPTGTSGLDDLRLHLKFDLLHGVFRQKTENFGLALIPVLTFPIGKYVEGDSFIGDSQVTIHTKLAFTANFGRVRIGLNLGYLWREEKEFYFADLSHRLSYGAAIEVRLFSRMYGIVELFGQNGFSSEMLSSPFEFDAALRYRFRSGIAMTFGMGAGIVGGVGTPAMRTFLALAYAPPDKEPEPLPPADRDGDTILDDVDACPDDPEDMDGFEDEDGCPDTDNDQDGIPDSDDECPDVPEDMDGDEDEDGCPEEPKALAVIDGNEIRLMQKIHFATNSSKIVGDVSFEVLEAVVQILNDNPEINVLIEGHTDKTGSRKYNLSLSKKRANSVKSYLAKQGISNKRLKTAGSGFDVPIADNDTEEGKAENRRVEFHILKQKVKIEKTEPKGKKKKSDNKKADNKKADKKKMSDKKKKSDKKKPTNKKK